MHLSEYDEHGRHGDTQRLITKNVGQCIKDLFDGNGKIKDNCNRLCKIFQGNQTFE